MHLAGGKVQVKEDKQLTQSHSDGKWGLTIVIAKVDVPSKTKTNKNKIYNVGTDGKQSKADKTLLMLERAGESGRKGEDTAVTVCDDGSG